ncbi:MAG TPA: hypothetical protein VFE20_00715 [Thermoleophilia bacterium]|nr:hypothetical protein [Thermoleophilia bacterium]
MKTSTGSRGHLGARIRSTSRFAAAFLVGIPLGFFGVFTFLLTDSTEVGDVAIAFAILVAVYALTGLAFGYGMRCQPYELALWLALPGLFAVFMLLFLEPGRILLHLGYAAAIGAASVMGTSLGTALRARF